MMSSQVDGSSLLGSQRSWLGGIVVCCLCIALNGCSEKKRQQIAAAVQDSVDNITESASELATQATQTVEEQLPASGKVSVTGDVSLESEQASISVLSVGDGRTNVVEIMTYQRGESPGAYPCFYFHGTTDVSDAASLSGSSVDCQVFVQATANAAIATTPPGAMIEVQFESYDPESKAMTARISSASLLDSDNKTFKISGGQIVAIVEGA